MKADLELSPDQVHALAPLLCLRGNHVLVANIFPNGNGWTLAVRALPAERRDAIKAACLGTLTLPKKRKQSPKNKQQSVINHANRP